FIQSSSMTWWSAYSAVPRFVLAKLAIRCRFVDRFLGLRVPSRVSVQRFSTHDTVLSALVSPRARSPASLATMQARRLPARAIPAEPTKPRLSGLADTAPGVPKPKASAGTYLEASTGLQHPLSTLHERRRRLPCKTRFRLAGCASTGRGSNPLDRCERFQVTF